MNKEILKNIEKLMKKGEIVVFHKASNGEIVWNQHPDLERFCLETLEGLKLQCQFHEKDNQ